jgi:hypothetical protein
MDATPTATTIPTTLTIRAWPDPVEDTWDPGLVARAFSDWPAPTFLDDDED